MANTKSAMKRTRQNEKRRLRNRIHMGRTRGAVKDAQQLIQSGNLKKADEAIVEAISALDRAVTKGVLHKNNVARRKSRLMAMLHRKQAETTKA
ncbi:MAG: 30S ribosomal protein S20 [Chloroflexi bacterium]|nr:30S ribosomal protein S20 [Chloroflexota bacterium]